MDIWKTWAYGTARVGATQIYRLKLKNGRPIPPLDVSNISKALSGKLLPRAIKYKSHIFYPDYPPGTFYLLWLVALTYRTWVSPGFDDGPPLNVAIKLLPVLAELATTILLWWIVRRAAPSSQQYARGTSALRPDEVEGKSSDSEHEPGDRREHVSRAAPLLAAGSYWLNPAVITGGALLAYLDALYSLVLVAVCGAMLLGRFSYAWIAWGVALAIKPQALLLLPGLLVLSIWRGPVRLLGYVTATTLTLFAMALSVMLSGNTLAMLAGISMNARDDYLSGYQVNLWWIGSYVYQAIHCGGLGVLTEPLLITDVTRRYAPYLSILGYTLFALVGLLLVFLWIRCSAASQKQNERSSTNSSGIQYRRDAIYGKIGAEGVILLALLLYAGTMLLQGSHENHLLGAVPLFALGVGWTLAAEEKRPNMQALLWLYAILSIIVCLNMLIFFGLGTGLPNPIPRVWFGLDGSIILAILNVFLFTASIFVWARLLLQVRGDRNKKEDGQFAQAGPNVGDSNVLVV